MRKGCLLLAGLAVATVVGEGFLRVFFPRLTPRTAVIAQFWRHDPTLGWSHIPNARGRFSAFGDETSVSINSKGFRDEERFYDRNGSKYRVVVLGDSLVWGYGVQQHEMFTALLEKRRDGVEAINLGVSGYGTDQELLLLRQEGVRYRPDLIVLLFVNNDFQTNVRKSAYLVYQKPMFALSENGQLALTNTPVPTQPAVQRVASALLRRSYMLNLAGSAYYQLRVGRSSPAPGGRDSGVDPTFPRNLEERIATALLLEIRRTVREAGAELLVVLIDGMGAQGRAMETFLAAREIRVLNLDRVFSSEIVKELYLPDGVHWNARGHRTVAERLLRYLEDEGMEQSASGKPVKRPVPARAHHAGAADQGARHEA